MTQSQSQSQQLQEPSRRNKAKLHPVLSSLSRELRGLRVSETFPVYGHEYTLGLLSPKDEDWIAERAASVGNNVFEFAAKSGKPRMAAALTAIDGVAVGELFKLPDEPDMTSETRKFLEGNREAYSEWLRQEVYEFVCNDMDNEVLAALERSYMKMDEAKKNALKQIGPLSARTPSNG